MRRRPGYWLTYVFGLVVSLILILAGIFVVVPRFGPLGVGWVVVMVLIACVHLFNLVRVWLVG